MLIAVTRALAALAAGVAAHIISTVHNVYIAKITKMRRFILNHFASIIKVKMHQKLQQLRTQYCNSC